MTKAREGLTRFIVMVVGVAAAITTAGTASIWLQDDGGHNLAIVTYSSRATTSSNISTTSTATSSTTTTTTIPPKGTLVIHGTGDVNLDPDYIPALARNGYDYAWEALDGIFADDDLTVVNLECAPSDLGDPETKEFVFQCPTESLASLGPAGIEVANLGNNHSGDFGKDALVDGRAKLTAAGVARLVPA